MILTALLAKKKMKEEMLARVLDKKRPLDEQEGRIRCELQRIENSLYELVTVKR